MLVKVSLNVEITSIITKKFCDRLELDVSKEASLVIKTSNVIINRH